MKSSILDLFTWNPASIDLKISLPSSDAVRLLFPRSFRTAWLARPAQKAGVYGVRDILHCRPSLKGLVSPLGREGAVLCPVPDGAGEEAAGTTCAALVAHDCLMVF